MVLLGDFVQVAEDAVYELAALDAGKFFGDFDGFVDGDEGANVGDVEQLEGGDLHDDAVHRSEAAELVVVQMVLDQLVDAGLLVLYAVDEFFGVAFELGVEAVLELGPVAVVIWVVKQGWLDDASGDLRHFGEGFGKDFGGRSVAIFRFVENAEGEFAGVAAGLGEDQPKPSRNRGTQPVSNSPVLYASLTTRRRRNGRLVWIPPIWNSFRATASFATA